MAESLNDCRAAYVEWEELHWADKGKYPSTWEAWQAAWSARENATPDRLLEKLEAEKAPYHENDHVGRNSNLTVDRCIAIVKEHFKGSTQG